MIVDVADMDRSEVGVEVGAVVDRFAGVEAGMVEFADTMEYILGYLA